MSTAVIVLHNGLADVAERNGSSGPGRILGSCPFPDNLQWHLALPEDDAGPQALPEGPWRPHFGPRGRGSQLDTALHAIEAEHFFVLHGDSLPSPRAWHQLQRWTRDSPEPGWGSFSLVFDHKHLWLSFLEGFIARRSSRGMPFGDQGLWMRRDLYLRSGGYHGLPLMEDLDLALRLNALTGPCLLGEGAVTTSARRYLEKGPFRTSVKNYLLRRRYLNGEDPAVLYREYYG